MYTRRMLDALAECGLRVGPLFTTGGWTNSQSLLSLRASVLGRPLQVLDEPQLAALGAARCGARTDPTAALTSDACAARTVWNDAASAKLYNDMYERYRTHVDSWKLHV